ncbi:MAG TPA: M15 family metallopeptidase, partial [Chthoniobacteraceae bacterium]|nr:M15 family metallopeptidase [Chthoniobacteraceae bacterium]
AYRPAWAQRQLWNAVRDLEYVVEPSGIGSLHGWGAAVDVTLVDARGREVRMPTDFDAFSDAAHSNYRGDDPEIVSNLATLKRAMATAGFNHIHDEWWHYSAGNAPGCGPIDVALAGPASTHKEVAKVRTDAAVKAAQANAIAALKKGKPRAARILFPKHASEPS